MLKTETDQKQTNPLKAPADQVNISADAHELKGRAELVSAARKELDKLSDPDMPQVRINQVMAKIMTGHYSRQEVMGSIVQNMLEEGAAIPAPLESIEVPDDLLKEDIHWDKIQEVRQKMENDFYNHPDIMDAIARELLI